MRVLLVGDLQAELALGEQLREADPGIELEVATQLEESIERIRGPGIDAVILDIGAPNGSGPDMVTRVRSAAPAVTVLVLTELPDDDAAVEALRRGAQDHLVKSQVTGVLLARCLRNAVERERTRTELQRALRRQDALLALGRLALQRAGVDRLAAAAVRRVVDALEVDTARVLEIAPGRKTFVMRACVGGKPGVPGPTVIDASPGTHAGYAFLLREPVIVADAGKEPRFRLCDEHDSGVVAGVAVPVEGSSQRLGVLAAHTLTPRTFAHDEVAFLQAVANVLGESWERQKAEACSDRLTRLYSVLVQCNKAIVRARNRRTLLREVCRAAARTGGFRMVWIGLIEPESRRVEPAAAAGHVHGYLDVATSDGPAGPAATAMKTGRPAICNSIADEPDATAWRDAALARGYRACASFPLLNRKAPIGALNVYAQDAGFFDSDETELLAGLAADISFALEAFANDDAKHAAEEAERRAHEARRRAEKRYREIFESAVEGIFQSTTDERILVANPALATILGYDTPEQLYADSPMASSFWADPAHRLELLRLLDERGTVTDFETLIRRRDGTTAWVAISARAVRGADGNVEVLEGSVIDISERKDVEWALGERVKELACLLAVSADAQHLESVDALCERVAARLPPATQFPDLAGAAVELDGRVYGQQQVAGASLISAPVFVFGEPRGSVSIAYREPRPFLPEEQSLIDTVAETISLFVERREAEASLRASEDRFRTSVEAMPDAFGILTAVRDVEGSVVDFRIDYLNRSAKRGLGAAFPDPVGRTLGELAPRVPAVIDVLRRVVETGTPFIDEVGHEDAAPGGTGRVWDLRATKFGDGVIAMSRDVTGRRESEAALARRDAILEAVSFAAEQFFRAGNWQDCIAAVARRLGEAAGVSRVRVLRHRSDETGRSLASLAHEWAAPGVTAQGTLATAAAPVFAGDEEWGALAFDECSTEREWSTVELDAIKIAADIVGAAVQRQRTEQALSDSEARFRLLAEEAQDIVYRYRLLPTRGFEYVSPSVATLMGYTPEEHYADPDLALMLVHPHDRAVVEAMQAGSAGELAEPLLVRWVRKDGGLVWVEQRNTPIADETGAVVAIQGIVRDVTSRTHAEAALQASEERFRALVQNSSDVISVIDADGTLLYASPATERMLGVPVEQLVGRTVTDLIHPDDRPGVVAVFDELAAGPQKPTAPASPIVEFRLQTASGEWRHLEARMNSRLDDPAVRGVVVNARDVTERIQAQEELRRSHERLQRTLESIADGFLTVDRDWRVTYINPQGERMLGRAAEDLLGANAWEIFPTAGHFISYDDAQRALEAKQALALEGYDPERRRWFDVRAYPGPDGFITYFRDVTERKRADEELRHSFDLLRKSDEQRRRLLSHLVRAQEEERERIAGDIHDDSIQVMTALGIRLQTFRRRIDDPNQLEALAKLEETAQLAVSRLRHLMFDLRPPALDVEGIVPTLRAYLEHLSDETEIRFSIENRLVLEPPPHLRTTAYRIMQEALQNVRKHAQATRVAVLLETRGNGLFVRVQDDGVGFDPSEVTTRTPGHLGMLSMRERAELAGGWLKVESEAGAGTVVELWVPHEPAPPGTD